MDLTALCMLSNYNKDSKENMAVGKYNPINEGGWEYESISKKLIISSNSALISELIFIVGRLKLVIL